MIILLNQKSFIFLSKYKNKSVVVPNFANSNEIIQCRDINDSIKKIVYVGGVIPEKGCNEIFQLAKQLPYIDFYLIGKVDNSLKKTIKENNVHFTGVLSQNEVKQYLLEADLFLFLSHYSGEGFSNALLEAMAYGLPCIVSDWAANNDMIENKGGIVVPPLDLNSTYEAIQQEQDPVLRKKQSVFNIQKVKKCYSENIILDRYVACYEQCLKEGDK